MFCMSEHNSDARFEFFGHFPYPCRVGYQMLRRYANVLLYGKHRKNQSFLKCFTEMTSPPSNMMAYILGSRRAFEVRFFANVQIFDSLLT